MSDDALAAVEVSRAAVPLGPRALTVEWFRRSATAAPGPAVLLLHGAEGLRDGERYRLGARRLAAAGVRVGLLHYLDATGETRVSWSTLGQHFVLWARAVVAGLDWLVAQPAVVPDRCGLVGISLGATLALQVASHDARVRAVVDYFGPLPQGLEQAPRLPPTLILHGALDRLVPGHHAVDLAALLTRRGVAHEQQIYPTQGHGFHGAADEDAARRSEAFLRRHLAGESGGAGT